MWTGCSTRLVDGLPPDRALVVTADHGQLDVPADRRFDLDTDPRLRAGVAVVAGEPRVRYLHTMPGARDDVIAAWQGVLGGAAWVVNREEAVAAGWFGPVPRSTCPASATWWSSATTMGGHGLRHRAAPVPMVAFHGSGTAAEMQIPLLVVRRSSRCRPCAARGPSERRRSG